MTTTIAIVPDPDPAELRLNLQAQAYDHKVSKANERFAKASPAHKRVTIAKDVLTWLGSGKLLPAPGVYLAGKFFLDPETNRIAMSVYDFDGEERGRAKEVDGRVRQDRVNGGQCAACALGGIFACAVERANGVQEVQALDYDDPRPFWRASQTHMHKYLQPYFDLKQLELIETAFERSSFCTKGAWQDAGTEERGWEDVRSEAADKAIEFGSKYTTASTRMAAIMENIIANKGTFIP